MELPLKLAAGAGVIVGSAMIAHFLYIAIRAPEKMNLGFAYNRRHTVGSWVYLGLVAVSWAAFAFSGAHGLLSWLPSDDRFTLSALIAFLSLGLLTHIEYSAYARHALRRSVLIRKEMDRLIGYSSSPTAGEIEGYVEQAKSAKSLSEREAHAEIARLATKLAERDNKLCDYAVRQAQREADERARQQKEAERAAQRAEEAAQAQVAKQDRQTALRRVLEEGMAHLPVIKTLNPQGPADALLDANVARQKWQPLLDFAERLRKSGPEARLHTLLQPVAGVNPRNGVTFEIPLQGHEHDGHYEVHSLLADSPGELADGLVFEASLDGAIAAFFLRAALPGQLAWGHGLYDRDQRFVTSLEQAVTILDNDRVGPDAHELRNVSIPPGLRIKQANGTLSISCLTYRPGKGFYDFSVSIADGLALPVQETTLFQWGRGILY